MDSWYFIGGLGIIALLYIKIIMRVEDLKRTENESYNPSMEKESADMLDRLVRDGEWTELKKNDRYQHLSTEGKILKALDAVGAREKNVNKLFYAELSENPAGSAKILKKSLQKLRTLQRALRARFVGELDAQDTPTEMTTILDIQPQEMYEKTA